MKRFGLLLSGLSFLCAAYAASAGVLVARRAGTETPTYNLNLSANRSYVNIYGQLAVTHVDEEFYNDNNMQLEGFYAFQLPDGAKVDGLWLWIDGKRVTFIVKKTRPYSSRSERTAFSSKCSPSTQKAADASKCSISICFLSRPTDSSTIIIH
jgi:hypothetical protein